VSSSVNATSSGPMRSAVSSAMCRIVHAHRGYYRGR
jgi:hypothetical protein